MKLIDYIKENHSGVVSQFAECNNMKRQQVSTCVDKGYYYVIDIDGQLMLVMAKKAITKAT